MPVFKQSLASLAASSGRAVPPFLESCFTFMMAHLEIEGIFRVPGLEDEIRRFISLADANGNVEFTENTSPFVVANLLTRFMLQIPGHVLEDKNAPEWTGLTDVNRYLLATIAAAALSEIFARLYKTPATVFLIIGIIPLVPGGGIYYTMEALINGDLSLFVRHGMETAASAGAIAVGCSLVSSVSRLTTAARRRRWIRQGASAAGSGRTAGEAKDKKGHEG